MTRQPSPSFFFVWWLALVVVMMVPTTAAFGRFSRPISTGQNRRYRAASPNNDNDNENNRSDGLRQSLLQVGQVLANDDTAARIRVGSTVVANSNVPELAIWQFQSYQVQDIWDQGIPLPTRIDDVNPPISSTTSDNDDAIMGSSWIEKISCTSLDDPPAKPGYTRYVSLYSAKHHDRPVTVQPSEVTLVSLQQEVRSSIIQALPLFAFWTALAISFATKYNERFGGNWMDAFWGR